MECLDCGEPLTGWGTAPDAGVSALLRKRCPACALRRHSEARYPPKAKPCAFCSKPHQRGSDRKFCSPVCRLAYGGAWRDHRKWLHLVARLGNRKPCTSCGVLLLRGLLCAKCKKIRVENNKENVRLKWAAGFPCKLCGNNFVPVQHTRRSKSTYWPSARQRGNHGKYCYDCRDVGDRIFRVGAAYEYVNPETVFARDGWRCQHCHIETPQILRGNTSAPNAPTLDHVLPIARGGAHSYFNTQC